MRKKVVIDVDTGVDDAQAIMIALTQPSVEVLAITCVSGNTHLDQVAINTLRVLRTWDRLDVPVYKGCDRSLLGEKKHAVSHGTDGLGDVPDPSPPSTDLVQKEHAVHTLLRLVNENPVTPQASTTHDAVTTHVGLKPSVSVSSAQRRLHTDVPQTPRTVGSAVEPQQSLNGTENRLAINLSTASGEITLVALAPLTNIALALRFDPQFGSKLKEAVIMGGNIKGMGNYTVSAEFNFSIDPESAKIVLNELSCPLCLLSIETCKENYFDWDWVESLMAVDTPRGRFHSDIQGYSTLRKRKAKSGTYFSCDPLAMTVAIDDASALESEKRYCTVELAGDYTRGQMVVDWNNKLQKEPNVTLVTKVNLDVAKVFFETMLK